MMVASHSRNVYYGHLTPCELIQPFIIQNDQQVRFTLNDSFFFFFFFFEIGSKAQEITK
jgi:hypothetical protein